MKAEFYKSQISQVLQMVEDNKGDEFAETTSIKVADFLDEGRHEREKKMFQRVPLIVAHSSEIASAGDYVVRQIGNRSWLLVRGDDGIARAFYNYCQHRGTKLVHNPAGECQRRFVCPYHAWTYNNLGNLIGLPRADLFPGLDKSKKGLKSADLQEAFGFLWLTQEAAAATPIVDYVDDLAAEFTALGLQNYHLYFDKTRSLKANWKLPIFAFLEPYHIAILHKQSIGDFFIQNVAHSEILGPHIRSFAPRKNVAELVNADLSEVKISEYVTPSTILFPNVCMIAHPTSMSVVSMLPGDRPDQCSWRHMLLTPHKPESDAERAHYDKTIAVLDGMTFEKEDFWASEQIQQGLDAGAIDELLVGKNEYLLKIFNDTVERYL